jgi:hypothetical protein
MRLLRTDTYELIEVSGTQPAYAILSHRWENEEITFRTLNPEALRDASLSSFNERLRPSAAKIRGACALAQQQHFDYLWIDTCCIDKSSSEELRTALNSMLKWYRQAAVCYTFLNDSTCSSASEDMFKSDRADRQGQVSEWFERGWTLQELLAPRKMEFYNKNWGRMGTRHELATLIAKVTGISTAYLVDAKDAGHGRAAFREASVATKMSWMAGRVTRDVEDIAYSLLGIFNVNLTPRYGEGIKAFARLQEAILLDQGAFDESLFAWQLPENRLLNCFRSSGHAPEFKQSQWGLLAPSPDCFKKSGNVVIVQKDLVQRQGSGFQKTAQGLLLTLPLLEAENWFRMRKSEITFPLNCWRLYGNQRRETIVLTLRKDSGRVYRRAQCERLGSQRGAKVRDTRLLGMDQSHLGVATILVPLPTIDFE